MQKSLMEVSQEQRESEKLRLDSKKELIISYHHE